MGIEGSRRSAHQAQWTAQFAKASELCKRGCQVARTLGKSPQKTGERMVRLWSSGGSPGLPWHGPTIHSEQDANPLMGNQSNLDFFSE
jgi:hypothetical protein